MRGVIMKTVLSICKGQVGYLTLEDGTDRFPQNVCTELQTCAA